MKTKHNIKICQCASCKSIRGEQSGENASNYKDGRTNKLTYCIDCNKPITCKAQRCLSCASKLRTGKQETNPLWLGGFLRNKCPDCGKAISVYVSRCQECYLKTIKGKNHWNYIDGLTLSPYSFEFTKELKREIRDRDNHKCQLCYKTEKQELRELNKVLSIHHIDYNRYNCLPENLITTCNACNLKVNANRDYYYAYFTYIMENYIYENI